LTLVGCNMVNLEELQGKLQAAGIDWDIPTIVLTECSLTYVEVAEADRLTSWLSRKFPNLLLVDYEQINPGDAFGRVMTSHFAKRNSPLRCISTYPTIQHHTTRFRAIGMKQVEVFTLSEIMSRFGEPQTQSDQFDEFEEVQMKCSHYILLMATNSDLIKETVLSTLVRSLQGCHQQKRDFVKRGEIRPTILESPPATRRYGNACLRTHDGVVILYGGSQVSGRDNATVKWKDPELGVKTAPHTEVNRFTDCSMFSAIALSADQNHFWVFGGRANPAKATCDLFKLSIHDLSVDDQRPFPQIGSRWRHSMTHVGNDILVIVGGRGGPDLVYTDVWKIDASQNNPTRIGHLPQGIHSHSACCLVGTNIVVVTGGLNPEGILSEQIFVIDAEAETIRTIQSTSTIPRFSHTSHHVSKPPMDSRRGMVVVALVGGVSSAVTQPEIGLLCFTPDLTELIDVHEMSVNCGDNIHLLYNHSSYVSDNQLTIIGGGGNCFSFGMSINKVILKIPLTDIIIISFDGLLPSLKCDREIQRN